MKKLYCHKILLSLMLVACCLVQGFCIANAVDIPRVVFENEENFTPDLYISKKVEASEEYEISDISFSFTLKLDGELANRLEYRVFDENGNEIFNYDQNNKVPFTTDRNGIFSLKDGQTAKFEYVGSGVNYEITEMATETEDFQQIEPSGGLPAIGTVTDKGASVTFKNRYIPEDDSKTADLVITKTVSFPDGYEMPETPDFTFTLTVSGKAYANEKYTITDIETGLETGSGQTDENGKFTLKGGTFATFSEVSTNVDYTVTENETEGWRSTGSEKLSGSISSPVTYADFNNVYASFAVTKTLEDNSKPDDSFSFILSGDDVTIPASYYLYTTKGERVTDEDGEELPLQTTDNSGKFKLKAGQTAIFVGIDTNIIYNIKEETTDKYIQIVPSSADGYQNKSVNDAVEVLPFVNKADVNYVYTLPGLGSMGEICLIIAGVSMISVSFVLFVRKIKKLK